MAWVSSIYKRESLYLHARAVTVYTGDHIEKVCITKNPKNDRAIVTRKVLNGKERNRGMQNYPVNLDVQIEFNDETGEDRILRISHHKGCTFINYLGVHYEENKGGEECPICLDEVAKDKATRLECCKRIFHTDCIQEARRSNNICPCCRSDVDDKKISQWDENHGCKLSYHKDTSLYGT